MEPNLSGEKLFVLEQSESIRKKEKERFYFFERNIKTSTLLIGHPRKRKAD